MSSQYVDPKDARKSYRPTSGTMSEGLKRARAPYRVKNAIVGLGLGAFGVGVWAYSISAVKQDVFDDVDEEARALGAGSNKTLSTGASTTTTIGTPSVPVAAAGVAPVTVGLVTPGPTLPLPPLEPPKSTAPPARGVLQSVIGKRWPGALDPERKTLVWGAPPVDNIGRMGGAKS